MVKVEDRIKTGIWYNTHVASITHKSVYSVVHILQAIVLATTSINIACVRKGCVVRLISNELVR